MEPDIFILQNFTIDLFYLWASDIKRDNVCF